MQTKPVSNRRPDRAEQIAAVAAELFCARGFAEVGIADIAAAAGVTGPALYRHFSDKQSILAHVVLAGIDDLVASTELALDVDGAPAPDRVASVLTALATLAVERRDVAVLWRWESHNLDATQQREVAKRVVGLIRRWADVLRGVRHELGADDAELLGWAELSVFGSVAVHHTRVGKRRYVELLVDRAHTVAHCSLPSSGASAPAPASVLQPGRREQLIVEAGRLFGERGFRQVSVGDVGAAVGIAGPSVYRHFPSKTALFVAAAHRLAQRLELGRAQVASVATTEADALHGLIESYVDTMSGCPGLLAQTRQVASALPASDATELLRVQREYVAEWVRLLRGVRPDLSPADARVTVHMALTIANDLLGTRRVQHRPNLHAELVALMTAALGV